MQGILMRPDNIQAIIEGRKTQTRRVIKPQPEEPHEITFKNGILTYRQKITYTGGYYMGEWEHIKPKYHIGETVYIKEAWAANILYDDRKPRDIPVGYSQSPIWYSNDSDIDSPLRGRWRSPLFMLEWAARYFIVIEQVRAERVQEITYGDCIAEGLDMSDVDYIPGWDVSKFKSLWNTINPKYPWESNPWLFVYTFRLKGGK